VYVLGYCQLGKGLLSVCMGGPLAYVINKDKSVRTVVPRCTHPLKDRSVCTILFSVSTVRKVKF
jgi:hypothetical protein